MTAHRTAGQLRALRELRALALTALDVADVIAAKGEETDDRPRAYLDSLARWTIGEETGPQLGARTRAAEKWRAERCDDDKKAPRWPGTWRWPWAMGVGWLADAREDLMRNPGHAHHTPRVCANLVDALARITGDSHEAAKARVAAWLDGHRRAVAAEWVTARRDAVLRQAKADKIEAERALGTLPGMETTR